MKKHLLVALISGLVASSAVAESNISASAGTTSLSTSASLKFKVLVPRILYLRVGSVGSTIDEVTFTVGLAAPLDDLSSDIDNVPYSAAIPPASGGAATVTGGAVAVQLWNNVGSVDLNCAGDALSNGSDNIPLADIKVTDGGTLDHPGTDLGCGSISVGSAGVTNLSDTWTYSYTPTTLPATGTYTTEITYTASQP